MARKRKSSFKEKVKGDVQYRKSHASNYGYLSLPEGVDVLRIEPGETYRFDIMPYEIANEKHPDRNDEHEVAMPGDLWYKLPFKIHRSVGVDETNIICPTTFAQPCPICEYRKKRSSEGADREELRAMNVSRRVLYCVIPIGRKDLDEEPYLMEMAHGNFQKLLDTELDEDDDFCIFPDLKEGMTLKVRFDEETFMKNTFARASRIDFKERKEVYEEDILDDVPSLDDVLEIRSYKEIEQMFFEFEDTDVEDDKDDEEEEKPKKSSRKKKKIKEEETESVDKEEEEEKPKRGKRSKKKKESEDKEDKCPYGHQFGIDTDEFEECAECEIWEECIDTKEEE